MRSAVSSSLLPRALVGAVLTVASADRSAAAAVASSASSSPHHTTQAATREHSTRMEAHSMTERLLYIERESVPWLDIFHAIHVARDFQKTAAPQPLLQLFVAYLLSSLGGGLLTSILLGQPVGWVGSDVTLLTYTIVFILAFSKWSRNFFMAATSLPLVRPVICVMDDVSTGVAVVFGVQRAMRPMHADSTVRASIGAALLCGTIGGCGGGVLRSLLRFDNSEWSLGTPRQLRQAGGGTVALAVAMAATFYALTNPHGYMSYDGVSSLYAKWFVIVMCIIANATRNDADAHVKQRQTAETQTEVTRDMHSPAKSERTAAKATRQSPSEEDDLRESTTGGGSESTEPATDDDDDNESTASSSRSSPSQRSQVSRRSARVEDRS